MTKIYSLLLFSAYVPDIEELCQKEHCKSGCHECPNQPSNFYIKFTDSKWVRVYKLADVLSTLRTDNARNFMLVAGNTAQGKYVCGALIKSYLRILKCVTKIDA